jgi:membrane associated rhomboid family serine protease
MIPLKDDNPTRRMPLINLMLIMANLVLFGYQYFYLPQGPAYLINMLGFIPSEMFRLTGTPPLNPIPGPLTLVTSIFIHGGWLHLLGNMLYLFVFGDNVEDRLGHGRYLIFYIASGICAGLVHGILFSQSSVPCVGASGAIAGVLAAYMFFYPKAKVSTLFIIFVFFRIVRLPAIVVLGLWIVLQIVSGMTELSAQAGGVAWFAHIGGFAAGAILALVLKPKKRYL